MGGDNGRKDEDALKAQAAAERARADEAIATAAKPDDLEARQRANVLALDDWEHSAAPNVRDMPGAGLNIALFNDAKAAHDAGRVGRGYGSMSDGANPNFTASLEKENQMERDLNASGALEGRVSEALASKDARMMGLTSVANSRNMNIAGMREGRYESDQDRALRYMMRQKKPSFLRELAMNAAQGAGQGATMMAGG